MTEINGKIKIKASDQDLRLQKKAVDQTEVSYQNKLDKEFANALKIFCEVCSQKITIPALKKLIPEEIGKMASNYEDLVIVENDSINVKNLQSVIGKFIEDYSYRPVEIEALNTEKLNVLDKVISFLSSQNIQMSSGENITAGQQSDISNFFSYFTSYAVQSKLEHQAHSTNWLPQMRSKIAKLIEL